MASSPVSRVIEHLRGTMLARDSGALTDGQLLERFVSRHEEAAFEALVRRLGPMVLGVCRRVLRNHHDAEDAFQATFLVLVRKAASIASRELLARPSRIKERRPLYWFLCLSWPRRRTSVPRPCRFASGFRRCFFACSWKNLTIRAGVASGYLCPSPWR